MFFILIEPKTFLSAWKVTECQIFNIKTNFQWTILKIKRPFLYSHFDFPYSFCDFVSSYGQNTVLAPIIRFSIKKIVSEYDQEIQQSQIQTTPRHREEEPLNHHETTPGRQIKQSNQLSLPHQDDCNTRMDIK